MDESAVFKKTGSFLYLMLYIPTSCKSETFFNSSIFVENVYPVA